MDNNNNWTNNKYRIIFTTLKSIEIEIFFRENDHNHLVEVIVWYATQILLLQYETIDLL